MRNLISHLIKASFKASLLTAFLAFSAQAQTGSSGAESGAQRSSLGESVFGLGVNVSQLSGYGLSMRHHLPNKLSYMLTAYAFKTSDELTYNFGGEIQYDLVLKERIRFYALGGGGHYYTDMRDRKNRYLGPDRFGAGVGIETNLIGNDFCVALSGAMISFQPVGDLIPTGSIAAHYYFR